MLRTEKIRSLITDDEAVYITGYPNIFYYSGFQSADAALLISADKAIIITDSRYTIQAKQQAPDFELYDLKNGLSGAFAGIGAQCIGYEEEYITAAQLERVRTAAGNKQLRPMQAVISKPREVKDRAEIERIKAAEELGDAAFSYITGRSFVGRSEREIAFELEFFMRKNGASALSFETIVASGERSAMPHGTASDKIIEDGDLVTMDFGCVLDGYCSDMTRTVAAGHISGECRRIYDIVQAAQQTALEAVCEGAELSAVDNAARSIIGEAGYGESFGHSLGHGVGIEIHENPCFSPRSKGFVKNGNVITVEPGIYIEGIGGVRIEDLTAVCDGKCEILSKSTKELLII